MKNLQFVSKLVSKELGLKEDLVELVNGFYWKEVRRKLSSLESTSVSIKHLGTITTSKRKIDQFIKVTIGKIRRVGVSTRYKESTKEVIIETAYDKLRKALVQRNILAKQYYEAYMERTSRVCSSGSDSVQTSSEDFGGSDERGASELRDAS